MPGDDVMTFPVPGGVPHHRARIEAVFEPPRMLDGWTCQLLDTATHVAGLILEIERAQGRSLAGRNRVDGAAPLIGSSLAIRAVRDRIERVAATDFTVLIEGESGTGKELVARQVHELSRRRKGPFVAVNCAAIVETLLEAELFGIEERTATGVRGRRGKFEHAHEGTLFLDEVSDLSPAAQAKLLRAIQDLSVERVGGFGARRVDTRIIVATNRPLSSLVELGRFRLDLYYRLHGVDVQVPPLRARREDITELARYFLERHRFVRQLQLSTAAADALLAYEGATLRVRQRLAARVGHQPVGAPGQVRQVESQGRNVVRPEPQLILADATQRGVDVLARHDERVRRRLEQRGDPGNRPAQPGLGGTRPPGQNDHA